jgi:catechol 2,3-dioxygenase-like lactoylglutathione lyase family enzyme
MKVSRRLFDVGVLTNQREAMLEFWRDEIGLPVERELNPVEGVMQYKLTMRGAVFKLNCVERPLPRRARLSGVRMLLLADPSADRPRHLHDPDGNVVCLVPPGYRGIDAFGVHFAVSDEAAFHNFFGEVLALPSIGDRMYDHEGATISFAWSPEVVPGADPDGNGTGYLYLTLQVMDVEATHAEVCGRGATEARPPSTEHTTTDSNISFILDPDGNQIEISQRPDLVAAALRQR